MAIVYLETYGCTLNQSDSDILKKALETVGHSVLLQRSTIESADAVVLNTCTVKGATESKIIERIKLLHRKGKRIVIAGCMTVNERLLKRIAPNAPIVGTSSIKHIANAVEDAVIGRRVIYKSREDKSEIVRSAQGPILRIPICEGCTSNCYFCQTKLARPFLFSYAPKTIMRWIENGLKTGVKEIQITAMDSGVYGLDIKTDLVKLLDNICKIDEQFFVRVGMINPQHAKRLGKSLIDILMNRKMYQFLHLPVQTGSEKVCKEMNRQHRVRDFVDVVTAARKKIPNLTIATDIIVGYPTETQEDFEKTINLMKKIKPNVVNVSKFSPREGTVAKKMKQLPTQILAKRSKELAKLVKEIATKKNEEMMGKRLNVVIIEMHKKRKDFIGRTASYKQVVIHNFRGKLGDAVKVRIDSTNYGSLFGEAV